MPKIFVAICCGLCVSASVFLQQAVIVHMSTIRIEINTWKKEELHNIDAEDTSKIMGVISSHRDTGKDILLGLEQIHSTLKTQEAKEWVRKKIENLHPFNDGVEQVDQIA